MKKLIIKLLLPLNYRQMLWVACFDKLAFLQTRSMKDTNTMKLIRDWQYLCNLFQPKNANDK
jgi:hypothetical protein